MGHVPHSPSYQEVEFEGLLHGTTSTKLISLTKTPRGQSSAPAELPLPPIPPLPVIKGSFSGSLKGSHSELPPLPKSDDFHLDSTSSPSVKKLFRLPATPGNNRKSMLIPAEYSTVEFETRMASYSDDEHNGNHHENETEAVKQKRRESRDDAWVDILIGSQTRRINDQDVNLTDRRRGHHSSHSDPDIASLEVAQVLATVQNRSPSPHSMIERVDRDYGMDRHVQGLNVDEVEIFPTVASSEESEAVLAYEADSAEAESLEPPQPVLTRSQMAKHQRRIGYFDLHPDRRQVLAHPDLDDDDDDLRAKLAEDSDDDIDDDGVYGPPDGVRPLPVPPGQQVQSCVFEPLPVIESISTLNPSLEAKEKHLITPDITDSNGSSIAPSTPSKTATLIEMYRERERGSSVNPAFTPPVPIVITPLTPSRLPRMTLPKEGAPPQPQLLSTSSSKAPSKPSLVPARNDLPSIQLEETGRQSPARYVHGSPLHNVLEEEEE